MCRAQIWPFRLAMPLCFVALLAMFSSGLDAAFADLTIGSTVRVAGLPSDMDTSDVPTFPASYTTYFHGESSRVDLPDGKSLIFDNDKDTVYELDPKLLTFRTGSLKDIEDFKNALPSEVQKRVTVDANIYTGSSVDTATYLSVTATRVPISGDAHIMVQRASFGGGRHRRSGGFPGGFPGGGLPIAMGFGGYGGNYGGQESGRMRFPAYNLTGSLWESPDYVLPKSKHLSAFPMAVSMVWGAAPLVTKLADQIDQGRQIPLHAEISVDQTYGDPDDDSAESSQKTTITTTFDVTSITSEPLSDSLFSVPVGYVKDDRPILLPQLAPPPRPQSDDSNQ